MVSTDRQKKIYVKIPKESIKSHHCLTCSQDRRPVYKYPNYILYTSNKQLETNLIKWYHLQLHWKHKILRYKSKKINSYAT